jgi:3-oxoadipate enol-lactonase
LPTLSRTGATVSYELIGDQALPCVTLINGHTRSSSDFRMMARNLGEAGFSALLIDNRGAGKSEVTQPFTIKDMWDDIIAIWDELGLNTSHLLGISMGGFIAQGLAIAHAARVGRLILISTASEEKFINSTGPGWSVETGKIEEKLSAYFAPGFVDRNPLLISTMVAQIRQAAVSGKFLERANLQRDAMRGASLTAKLGEIKAKTLIIHGDLDQVIPVAAAKVLQASIPGAEVKILQNTGHLLLAEAPKELYRLVIDYLGQA